MYQIKARFVAAAVGAVLATGMAAAGSANAAVQHPKTTAGQHFRLAGLPRPGAQPSTPTTDEGSGYYSYPGASGGVTGASVTFTVPAITCKKTTDLEWLLPGIWVYDPIGDLTQQVDVNLNCNDGVQLLVDVICISGTSCNDSLTISPGDRIVASLAESSVATTGTIHDLTTAQSAQVVGPAITTDYTVFLGVEGPAAFGVSKVPTFGKIAFSKAQVNGQYLSDWSPLRYNLETQTSPATIQVTASALTGDGDAFKTTFQHN